MSHRNLLLPTGFYDTLPPDARKETAAVSSLLAAFESYGYQQVSPPLVEFENSLLAGRGEELTKNTFRVMDTISQHMMGIRSDMTLQIARIAHSRLAAVARPLRLSYAGHILRRLPEDLKNERQLMQTGIELIGSDSASADAEVIIVAAEALAQLGISDIAMDINLPGLLAKICPEVLTNIALQESVSQAVLHKDFHAITKLPIAQHALLAALMDPATSTEAKLATLNAHHPQDAVMLRTIISQVKAAAPEVTLTFDPLEYRGFDYHDGISFSIFAKGLRHELGRGGRYHVNNEASTGFTIYVTYLLELLAAPKSHPRVLVTNTTAPKDARQLRADGWVTLGALSNNLREEAQQLECTHIFNAGKLETL